MASQNRADDGREVRYHPRGRRKTVPREVLQRFDHLLWTWHVKRAKDLSSVPLKGEKKPLYFPRLRPPGHPERLQHLKKFKDGLGEEERVRGEKMEERCGDGNLTERRDRFKNCLELLQGKGCDVIAVCEALAEVKYDVLSDYRELSTIENVRILEKEEANYKKLRKIIWKILKHEREIHPLVDTLREVLKCLDREQEDLDWALPYRRRGRGRPKNRWRLEAEQKLKALGVDEDSRRELYRLIGLAPLKWLLDIPA